MMILKKIKSEDGIDYKKSKKVKIVFNKSQPWRCAIFDRFHIYPPTPNAYSIA